MCGGYAVRWTIHVAEQTACLSCAPQLFEDSRIMRSVYKGAGAASLPKMAQVGVLVVGSLLLDAGHATRNKCCAPFVQTRHTLSISAHWSGRFGGWGLFCAASTVGLKTIGDGHLPPWNTLQSAWLSKFQSCTLSCCSRTGCRGVVIGLGHVLLSLSLFAA